MNKLAHNLLVHLITCAHFDGHVVEVLHRHFSNDAHFVQKTFLLVIQEKQSICLRYIRRSFNVIIKNDRCFRDSILFFLNKLF